MNTRSTFVGASALLLTALGCRDDSRSPTEPTTTTPQAAASVSSAVGPGTWITKADYPFDIWGSTSASITNPATGRTTLYVIGGYTQRDWPGTLTTAVKAYNVSANVWRPRAPYPRRVKNTNGAMVIDGKVYVSGGFSRRWDAAAGKWRLETLATLYVYDPAVDRWTRKRDMPVTSAKGVSAVYHGKLYVAAGYPDALFRYDPTTDRWVRLTDVPYDTFGSAGGFIGGNFYLVSYQGTGIYDLTTDTWSSGAPLPVPRSCEPAYTTFQAKLYVTWCPGSDAEQLLVYGPKVNAWTQLTAPPPRTDPGALRQVRLANGEVRLELVGGSRPGNNLQYIP